MKTPKLPLLKNQTTDHAVGDVGDEVADVVEAAMDLAKRLHAASDLLRLLVDQNVTRTISKTTIWIPMQN
jgi:hypothetical protein